MACEAFRKPQQTPQQRADEVRKAIANLDSLVSSGRVRVKIGPQGAIVFDGWTVDRGNVSDACAYRKLMAQGSPLAKAAIAKAEQLAGRGVSRQALSHGVHSHDGGKTWHGGH